ncbi:MAG: HAD-IA family hydrolase [Woeseiaceae bacterium]
MTKSLFGTPAAVVFDLDGTLADTAPDIRKALNRALGTRELTPLGLSSVRLMIGAGPRTLVERALRVLDVAANAQLVDYLTDEFERCYLEQGNMLSKLFDGVKLCVFQLAARQIPLGICSNKPHDLCLAGLADLGILHCFGAVSGTSPGVPKKPDPTLLLRTLDRLGSLPENALYVGDSETDVKTARDAGVPVALVSYGYATTPADQLGADLVVDTLSELQHFFSRPPADRLLLQSAMS